jgi:hypothetical protein
MATFKVTRFPRGLAIGGGALDASSASCLCALRFSFDPTSSTQILLGTLPKGAVVVDVLSYGGATGGTNPTIDIGTSGTTDAYANELKSNVASAAVGAATIGTGANTQLTADTLVYGKVGASAATGGTTKGAILFVVEDI